ncbi:MAG: AmmeMemoRadiSam system protein A [Spirochaetes bacterium]|nr:AmmeMemoRadiSam system protein A [Spirochaetota bacterium]
MSLTISAEERLFLLALARDSIASALAGRKLQEPALAEGFPNLKTHCGVFVSLHDSPPGGQKEGQLRGCIGRLTSVEPLYKTVQVMAREAAFSDPRFAPLQKEELQRCSIEISALSPMTLCFDPKAIKVGLHGLYLKRMGRSGVFLPQVPVQQRWNLEKYLEHLCMKARLPQGSFCAPDAELYTFTAEVFSEE